MFEKIQHPKTGKWHKTSSSTGSQLIKNYSKQLNQVGGVICSALKPSHGIVYLKAVNDEYLMLRSHILIYATNPLGNIHALQSVSAAEVDLNKSFREWYLQQRPAPGRLHQNSARGISAARVDMLNLYAITKKNARALRTELTQLMQRARQQQQHARQVDPEPLGRAPLRLETAMPATTQRFDYPAGLDSDFGNPFRDE